MKPVDGRVVGPTSASRAPPQCYFRFRLSPDVIIAVGARGTTSDAEATEPPGPPRCAGSAVLLAAAGAVGYLL